MKTSAELAPADQDRFYSHWMYTAMHALVSIPEFQTSERLATALGLSLEVTKDALDFLHRIGIMVKKNGHLSYGPRVLHLGSESPLIAKHHYVRSKKISSSLKKRRKRKRTSTPLIFIG